VFSLNTYEEFRNTKLKFWMSYTSAYSPSPCPPHPHPCRCNYSLRKFEADNTRGSRYEDTHIRILEHNTFRYKTYFWENSPTRWIIYLPWDDRLQLSADVQCPLLHVTLAAWQSFNETYSRILRCKEIKTFSMHSSANMVELWKWKTWVQRFIQGNGDFFLVL
jgi:hypothetical protein